MTPGAAELVWGQAEGFAAARVVAAGRGARVDSAFQRSQPQEAAGLGCCRRQGALREREGINSVCVHVLPEAPPRAQGLPGRGPGLWTTWPEPFPSGPRVWLLISRRSGISNPERGLLGTAACSRSSHSGTPSVELEGLSE